MKKIMAAVGLICVASLTKADVIADWTFEGTGTDSDGNNSMYGAADSGTVSSSASGYHANTSTDWTFPAGNGSLHGYDADHWTVGDYFQFSVSTVGYNQISVTFDQISSGTGPGKFLFKYSTDGGTTFTPLGSDYTITRAIWSSGSQTTLSTFTEPTLASITGLDNDATVIFRLVDDSTTSEGGGTVGSTGASHVDNFIISGSVVPELAGWGMISAFGLLGVCGLHEWRQHRAAGRKFEILKSKT